MSNHTETLALIKERADPADVPKLVSTLEAVLARCDARDEYHGYSVDASVNVDDIRDLIREALKGQEVSA
ncbi:hypothetical protein D6T65_05155 [Arthrobacter frigidicola]|nr:hypothetical protein D6T65_05155 [Arthrobacter frigidicola]